MRASCQNTQETCGNGPQNRASTGQCVETDAKAVCRPWFEDFDFNGFLVFSPPSYSTLLLGEREGGREGKTGECPVAELGI